MTLSSDLERYRAHPLVSIARIDIGNNTLAALKGIIETLPQRTTIAILADSVDYVGASGTDIKSDVVKTLRSLGALQLVLLDGDVHADERTVSVAVEGCSGADVVVTVGSGTLCDIGKVAAGDRPHVVVQTAASVNGFADDQSVLLINGAKRTTHSGWPTALIVDADILQGAPLSMNRSGLGDMVSMFTAPADWYLSSLVNMAPPWDAQGGRREGRSRRLVSLIPGQYGSRMERGVGNDDASIRRGASAHCTGSGSIRPCCPIDPR